MKLRHTLSFYELRRPPLSGCDASPSSVHLVNSKEPAQSPTGLFDGNPRKLGARGVGEDQGSGLMQSHLLLSASDLEVANFDDLSVAELKRKAIEQGFTFADVRLGA